MSNILYSKLRLEVPQELDGENAIITSSKGISRNVTMSSPFIDIMLAGMEKYNVQAGYINENISFGYGQIKKMQAKALPDSLENATWQDVRDTIKYGTFSQYASVGDTKSFVLNGKTYHAEVVAINDGTGDAGSWYPDKTVDFICTELYETAYQYNSSNTKSGGFPSSVLKNTLIDTIYPLFPSDLKAVIIDKPHSYNSNESGAVVTIATKLWIPTRYEIIGSTSANAPGETASNNKKYTLASLIKNRNGQTSADIWWLGSLNSVYNLYFWYISSSAGIGGSQNATASYGIPLGFRIG